MACCSVPFALLLGLWLALSAPSDPAQAEALVVVRPVRAGAVLEAADLARSERVAQGALRDLDGALGMETKRNLYPGQPIFQEDLQAPRIVLRNQIVSLNFSRGGLTIVTEGRALDSGAIGDVIRVLNSSSRKTVAGLVRADGTIIVTRMQP